LLDEGGHWSGVVGGKEKIGKGKVTEREIEGRD